MITLDVANSKYKIANVHESQGQLEEAKALFLECEKICAKVLGNDHENTQDARQRSATVGKQKNSVVDHKTPVAAHTEAAAVGRRKPSEDKDGEDVDDDTGLLHGMASLQMQDPHAFREASQEVLQNRKIIQARRSLQAGTSRAAGR